ncbi:MAG: anthranilate synthase component I [Proteobacteria bacterium]|nr:anthranilate synthase component I [Pseudomonadota bacterium]MBU1688853.1 anthranilate synthase component I [Pseudomonadota bacterium]
MHQPDLKVFTRLAGEADLIPVHREIIADLDTPLTIFAKVAGAESHAFLFESLEGGEKWGRYSFVGYDPLAIFESHGSSVTLIRGHDRQELSGNPFDLLKDLLQSFKVMSEAEYLPRFFGGAVGFLGYDMVRFMEHIPDTHPAREGFPDSSFMIPGMVLIYDNLKQTLSIVNCLVVDRKEDLPTQYAKAMARIDQVVERLRGDIPEAVVETSPCSSTHNFTSNMTEKDFSAMVVKAKEYILAGDVIQVVLAQRFHTETDLEAFRLYRALRHINPSPYLFYLKQGDLVQIGSSPEILVRLENDEIELRPIAGTRRRGRTEEEDFALEKELLSDPKERAEHFMLVDLGRNDVGRVAGPGQVETRDLMVIERYSHVMHIVSGVHGRLAPGKDQFDVLKACFPAGTVSGAPKIRAMEIIEELEPDRRGPYAGAVGYFGFSGNMDFCITIRTFILKGRDLWIQAGAGIVADSDPASEFEETVNKSMGLRRAVELAEKW